MVTTVDRFSGVRDGLGRKAPCRVATTGNITLAGLQAIDGVTVVEGDRVLVRSQSDGRDNGIYNASTGNWQRALDFNGNRDVVGGTGIVVTDGDENARYEFFVSFEGRVVIGTSDIDFFGLPILPVDIISTPKPMQPFSDVQRGHFLPYMDQNAYFEASQWAFENPTDNPLYDGGITAFAIQSLSTSTLSQNIVGMTGSLGGGDGTVTVTPNALNFAEDKTIALQLDDNSIHVARITAVAGSDITFTPAIPSGKTITSDGTVRQVAVSRAAQITVDALAGATGANFTSIMGISGAGEYIRIELDDGTTHLATVTANGGPGSDAVFFTPGLASAASAGNLAYVGPHDVDPNFTIGRRNSRAVPGDFLGAMQFVGPNNASQKAIAVQYVQIYAKIVESDPANGYQGLLAIGTADDTSSGTTRDILNIGNGVFAPGLNDPGLQKLNMAGIGVNNGPQLVFQAIAAFNLDFPSISANDYGESTQVIAGAAPGDHATIWITGDFLGGMTELNVVIPIANQIKIRVVNNSGSPIDPASGVFNVLISRYA